jgi:membrane-bound lytic murein transglycosylase B
MPSNYLTYATDGDGDERADIWGSDADTLASIGAYLQIQALSRTLNLINYFNDLTINCKA